MKISADKVKLCYTLYEDTPLYQLMETPLEIYELPHWDFRFERTEGKYRKRRAESLEMSLRNFQKLARAASYLMQREERRAERE